MEPAIRIKEMMKEILYIEISNSLRLRAWLIRNEMDRHGQPKNCGSAHLLHRNRRSTRLVPLLTFLNVPEQIQALVGTLTSCTGPWISINPGTPLMTTPKQL